jgi:hypothetical protein
MIDQKDVEARLVERLRDQVTLLDYAEFMQDSVDKRRLTNARKMLNDAADAIERLTASQARDEIVEECAKVAEMHPLAVLMMWDRPGGPPGNGYRPATFLDVARAIRSLKTGDRDAG